MLAETLALVGTALTGALDMASGALLSPLDFLFKPWEFRIQGKNIFGHDEWDNAVHFLRVGSALVVAGLLLLEVRARRLGYKLSDLVTKRIAIGLTILGFFLYFDFFNPNVRYADYYHRHEFFHYYLGSKYSHEVGYTRLYECSAIAEVELGRAAQLRKREIRDLRVNLIKPMTDTYIFDDPAQCKKNFSPERWESFKKDVAWFERSSRGSYWENMHKDHGYNPPPVWTMQGKFFASFGVAEDGFFKLLSTLDVMIHVGVIAMMGWAFGLRIMAIAALFWGINAPANFYWTGGAFLRQDWIFFFVASVCLLRKRRFAMAGAALTWSSLLRVFPMIVFGGWILVILFHLIKKRKLHPDHQRLIAGCVVAAGILIPASMIVAGPESYAEFVSHIRVHKNTPLTNHMGLETMLVHDWDGRMHFTRDDTLDDPFAGWKSGRLERFAAMQPVFFLIVLGVLAWMAWALRRTKLLWVASALSLPLVLSLTNLTCYYYSMFIIAAALVAARPAVGPALLAAAGASQVLLRTFFYIDDKYTALSYLFYALSLSFLWIYSRPFSVERLKAWWRGEPELRPADKSLTPTAAPAE